MQFIPLNAIPNQIFSIDLDNHSYNISIKLAINVMVASIIRDNIPIIISVRLTPWNSLIPYPYLESGNFALVTANDEYPIYTQFQITQFLVYASQLELNQLRGIS